MAAPIRVLIVEDDPEFMRRFSQSVLLEPRLALCGAVCGVTAARGLLDTVEPDVVLTDLGLPDGRGIDVIRYALGRYPGCDVVVVTMFEDEASVTECIVAGATGYLLKDALPQQLADALIQAREGGAPISPSIARFVLERMRLAGANAAGPAAQPTAAQPSPLSNREIEILRLSAKGLSYKGIGEVLAISPHTVNAHIKKIYQKLAVHSRGEAVFEAGQLGLL